MKHKCKKVDSKPIEKCELNRDRIIKALECCIAPRDCECDNCPFDKYGSLNCKWLLMSNSLALIKELTEENEKWRETWADNQSRWEKAYDELDREKHNIEMTLIGVMFFVDKWLDGAELEMDEVNRAITMREKTLKIVETLTEKWEEAINQSNYIADVTKADTVRKMQDKVIPIIESLVELMWDDNEANCIVESCNKPDSIGCGNRICIDENKALWVAKIDQIAEEMLEETK